MKRFILSASLILVILILARLTLVVGASPPYQLPQFSTPTPGPDGKIIYIVQPGDSCIRVALLHNISVEQLRALNSNLNADCILLPNQPLVVGFGGPVEPTPVPGSQPTPGPLQPTPTPFSGSVEVCVLLFNDLNGDSLRQSVELSLPGGVISLSENSGLYSQAGDTLPTTDPEDIPLVCFTDAPEGRYTVSAAIPDDFNATTALTYSIDVRAGDTTFVAFGAQAATQETTGGGSGRISILGILGFVLLVTGIGLAVYAQRLRSPGRKLKY